MYFFICLAAFIMSAGAATKPSPVCVLRDGYVAVDGVCDAYIECKDFNATKKLCPDGLYFNANTSWPEDPCAYPSDVSCEGRTQSAKSTPKCKHQYGFYPTSGTNPNDCGQYIMCVAGRAIEMFCPTGLAFNPSISRCDWPENVPSCNLENFLGFECPAGEMDTSGNPVTTNYKYEGSCTEFYSCVNGKARLLSCDEGYAFDPKLSRCVLADRVRCDSKNKQI